MLVLNLEFATYMAFAAAGDGFAFSIIDTDGPLQCTILLVFMPVFVANLPVVICIVLARL